MLSVVILLVSLVGVLAGADLIVNGAVRIARSLNVSEAFIGLTVLSVGTSLPEIFTHIMSSIEVLRGQTAAAGISIGTNVGSNVIQITLILGLVGIFSRLRSDHLTLRRDYVVMLGGILLLFLLGLNGFIGRIEGVVLALLYIAYLIYLGKNEKVVEHNRYKTNYLWDGTILVIGFVLLLFCADLVVDEALLVASDLGVATTFIGTMIIGVATALPELTTSIMALVKRSADLSLGTLIGSNITNPMLALGIGAAISGYEISRSVLFFDIPFWFIVSLIGLAFFWKKMELRHWQAGVMVAFYGVFAFFQILSLT